MYIYAIRATKKINNASQRTRIWCRIQIGAAKGGILRWEKNRVERKDGGNKFNYGRKVNVKRDRQLHRYIDN